jgi:hypothetical protein
MPTFIASGAWSKTPSSTSLASCERLDWVAAWSLCLGRGRHPDLRGDYVDPA